MVLRTQRGPKAEDGLRPLFLAFLLCVFLMYFFLSINRAGAFQFIDATSSDQLPLPYQIQIISHDGGRICWRYPQPRAIQFIQIFPVPMHSQSTSSSNQKSIKCQLEYYSDAVSAFRPYCDFYLSEKHIQELPLPAQQCTSETWRIVVHQSYVSVSGSHFQGDDDSSDADDDDDDDDEHQNIDSYLETGTHSSSNTILNPKALVGCMRVDSYFNAKLVPDIQMAIGIAHFSLSLRNTLPANDYPKPDVLKPLSQHLFETDSHEFFRLNLRNTKSFVNLHMDNRIFGSAETMLSSSILDLSYAIMQPFVEQCQCSIGVQLNDTVTDVNVVTDAVRMRYGQAVGHTLLVSEQIWRQALMYVDDETTPEKQIVLATRFVVINSTSDVLRFGQTNTSDQLYLQPNTSIFYSFRSPLEAQKLSFASLESSEWSTGSIGAVVGAEGTQTIRISNDRFVFVKVDKLTATQRSITIKGQVEFLNMCSDVLQVKYKWKCYEKGKNHVPYPEFSVQPDHSLSVVSSCSENTEPCFR